MPFINSFFYYLWLISNRLNEYGHGGLLALQGAPYLIPPGDQLPFIPLLAPLSKMVRWSKHAMWCRQAPCKPPWHHMVARGPCAVDQEHEQPEQTTSHPLPTHVHFRCSSAPPFQHLDLSSNFDDFTFFVWGKLDLKFNFHTWEKREPWNSLPARNFAKSKIANWKTDQISQR